MEILTFRSHTVLQPSASGQYGSFRSEFPYCSRLRREECYILTWHIAYSTILSNYCHTKVFPDYSWWFSASLSIAMWQVRMSFFQPKLGLIWKFFPSGAQKSQTVLQPSASGQSDSFGLLQERISRLVLPSARRKLHTVLFHFLEPTREGYSPGRQEESSQEILKSHRKFWWKITHFVSFLKTATYQYLLHTGMQLMSQE